MERLTIKEAAQRLSASEVTIRRKIKRGELQAEQEDTAQGYRWVVLLPVTFEPPPSESEPETVPSGEVGALRETIRILQGELEVRNREVERLHGLLAREQEIARNAQLQLPETTTPRPSDEQAMTTQSAADQPWWSRVRQRLFGA